MNMNLTLDPQQTINALSQAPTTTEILVIAGVIALAIIMMAWKDIMGLIGKSALAVVLVLIVAGIMKVMRWW